MTEIIVEHHSSGIGSDDIFLRQEVMPLKTFYAFLDIPRTAAKRNCWRKEEIKILTRDLQS